MPRANRYFVADQVWHLTHRCHEKSFLLKFARDRDRYLHWLFEARKRFGLCVLDYMVTSNHVHLLVKDTGEGVVPKSMQLVAGRAGQEYNARKHRTGAFWEDRYHATAIESGKHLRQCLVYIDLNMVRAGAVKHPAEWPHSGYRELQQPPERYVLIDCATTSALCGFAEIEQFHAAHRLWVEEALAAGTMARDDRWSESIAVGSRGFVERMKVEMGIKARHRGVTKDEQMHVIREPSAPYTSEFPRENRTLSADNTLYWSKSC